MRQAPYRAFFAGPLLTVSIWLSGCVDSRLSALDPAGPAAKSIAQSWHLMAWGATAILVFMVILTAYAVRRRPKHPNTTSTRILLAGGGLFFPGAVLLLLLVYGFRAGDAQLPLADEHGAYRVQVHAHQWWWEVIYPDAPGGPLHSANIIHAPAGRPVLVTVTAEDVIHAFWIPRLGGKIDAIPGRENTIRLQANEPGVYFGICAEFCGDEHSNMPVQFVAYDEATLEATLLRLRKTVP